MQMTCDPRDLLMCIAVCRIGTKEGLPIIWSCDHAQQNSNIGDCNEERGWEGGGGAQK